MSRRVATLVFAAVVAVAAIAAPATSAAKPTFERIPVEETVNDPFLSEICEFDVTVRAEGHIIVRTFDGTGPGPVSVRTLNIGITAMANDKTYRFRDVGADVVRVTPDGTEILMVIGQIPFGWTGVLKVNLTTGETILEPQHSLEPRAEELCAALAADE